MKAVLRICAISFLAFCLVPAALADDTADKAKARKDSKTTSSPTKASKASIAEKVTASGKTSASTLPVGSDSLFPARPKTSPGLPAGTPQGSTGRAGSASDDPEFRPIPATTGALGYFTVDSAQMLPERGWSLVGYANKFARMPGAGSIVGLGLNFGYGFTDWMSGFVQFEPYRHIHISKRNQLSLLTPISNPAFPSPPAPPTIFRGLIPAVPGSAPGYMEEFPFANRNDGSIGDVSVGLKFRLLGESKGDPFSLSFTNTFFIPTETRLSDLLDNQVQLGAFSNRFGLTGTKTWGNDNLMSTLDFGYRVTRDPRSGRQHMFELADQLTIATGTIIFPNKRLQLMTEHVATIFTGTSTQNTTFGARDPFDGVYGIRWYAFRNTAVDVGYRRTWNLSDHGDKNGFVIKLGTGWWPEKAKPIPNRAPTAACSAEKSTVVEGSGDVVGIRAMASDPDADTLSYSWTATGGSVDGSGPMVKWNSANARVGTYTVTANVSDGKGGTASCSVDVRVEPRPNRAPSLTCSADRTSVITGERIRITGTGSDPDGETLNYSWRTNGGQIVGSGQNVHLDTTGLAPGSYRVTGRVEDPRGAAADCSVDVSVNPPPAKPQASKISECFFRAGSARVDNVCKRVMDDVAVRMQNEPRARVVLIGYADPKEPRAAKLGQSRADESKKYLVSKGIDAGRIDTRSAGGQAGATKENRRVDVIFVPEGATY